MAALKSKQAEKQEVAMLKEKEEYEVRMKTTPANSYPFEASFTEKATEATEAVRQEKASAWAPKPQLPAAVAAPLADTYSAAPKVFSADTGTMVPQRAREAPTRVAEHERAMAHAPHHIGKTLASSLTALVQKPRREEEAKGKILKQASR